MIRNLVRYMKNEIAGVNGYSRNSIDVLVRNHKRKTLQKHCSSFFQLPAPNKFRVAFSFNNNTFGGLYKHFAKRDMCVVPKNKNKICDLLHTTKDVIKLDDRPVIYLAECAAVGCNAVYIGQTQRYLKVHITEHLRDMRNGDAYKSGLAEHMVVNGPE